MSNYLLARILVDDIMQRITSNEPSFYMEYVRSVETLLDKYRLDLDADETKCSDCGGHNGVHSVFCSVISGIPPSST